jgi:hypothetical protein
MVTVSINLKIFKYFFLLFRLTTTTIGVVSINLKIFKYFFI